MMTIFNFTMITRFYTTKRYITTLALNKIIQLNTVLDMDESYKLPTITQCDRQVNNHTAILYTMTKLNDVK